MKKCNANFEEFLKYYEDNKDDFNEFTLKDFEASDRTFINEQKIPHHKGGYIYFLLANGIVRMRYEFSLGNDGVIKQYSWKPILLNKEHILLLDEIWNSVTEEEEQELLTYIVNYLKNN
jgi:uncharacterized membrane protein